MRVVLHFRVQWSIVFLAVLAVAGCSTTSHPPDARAFAAPTQLTARLLDPINIELRWRDNATDEAGYFVEYSPNANDEFVIIEALPPNSTRYRHERLLPQTRFVYRVRPFFGKPSNIAEVMTGKEGPQQPPHQDLLLDPPPSTGPKYSVMSTATADAAAPTDLTAVLIPPAGVKLQWKDHANDEDGYLLEIKPPWSPRFHASSFLDAGTMSLITYNLPHETKMQFRVRAFFYGKPSNVAEKTTGIDPTLGPGPWIKSQ